MIHHISMTARDPRHVAEVFAEILGGMVVPTPPNFQPNSWFAMAKDEHGTMIEVLPEGTELQPGDEEADFVRSERVQGFTPAHAYVSVNRSAEEVLAIGAREGWLTRLSPRGPLDQVIECWVENRHLIEFAPPEILKRYLDFMTNPEAIRAAVAEFAPGATYEG